MEKEETLTYIESQLGSSLQELEDFPAYINIETINTCNARCIMCGIDFDSRPVKPMPEEIFEKILSEISLHAESIRKVNLYLDCEPLLDKKLHVKIRRLKDAGIKVVCISSNASALTEKRGKELIEAGLDQIYITIDSLEKKRYEAIRVGLKFDAVYQNTLNFVKLRNSSNSNLVIRVQMVSMQENQGEEQDFVRHWEELLSKRDLIAVHMAHNWGGAVADRGQTGDSSINQVPCTILWSNTCIHSDGSVALCSVDTVASSGHSLGNVTDNSILEIWRGERLRRMREMHLNGKRSEISLCNGCTAWRPVNNHVMKSGKN